MRLFRPSEFSPILNRARLPLAGLMLSLAAGALAQDEPVYFQHGDRDPVAGNAPNMSISELGSVSKVVQINMSNGDEAVSGLLEYVQKEQPAAGFVTGIGGFESAVFSWYDPEKDAFLEIPVDMKGEVVNFSGSVAWNDGSPSVHIHALMSMADGSVRGGHLVSGQVSPVLQVQVFEMSEE